MINVAILGASGFVGKNLMLRLSSNWNTYAFYNTSKDFTDFVKKNNIKATLIKKDLSSDFKISNRYPHNFDLVISLLGNTRHISKELQPHYDLNADGLAIAGFFKKFTCDKMIYFSSTGVYENHVGLVSCNATNIIPTSSYGITKYLSERLINYYKKEGKIKEYLIIRLSGAYGPYQRPNRLINRLIKRFYFEKGRHIFLIGNGQGTTDLCFYVQDVIDFIFLAKKQNFQNETIDFCTGVYMPLNQLINLVIKNITNIEPIINWNNNITANEHYYFKLNNEKPFNFEMKTDFQNGITKLCNWFRENSEYLPLKADVE